MDLSPRGTGPPLVSKEVREGDQPDAVTRRLSESHGLQDEALTGCMEEVQAMVVGMTGELSEHAGSFHPGDWEGQAPTCDVPMAGMTQPADATGISIDGFGGS